MREFVTSRLPWRSLLIIGMVTMIALPSWSLSQQPPEVKKPDQPQARTQHFDVFKAQQGEGEFQVQFVSDDKQPSPKETDRLDRLEKQLDALLMEIKTLRGEKAGIEKRPGKSPDGNVEKRVLILSDKQDGVTKPVKGQYRVNVVGDKHDGPKTAAKDDVRVNVEFKPEVSKKENQVIAYQLAGGDGGSTMLSRTTYKMPKEKAEALAGFLKDQVKSQVLETKVDGDSIVVTTTPEAQHTIGQFIALVQGKQIHARVNLNTSTQTKTSEPVQFFFRNKQEGK